MLALAEQGWSDMHSEFTRLIHRKVGSVCVERVPPVPGARRARARIPYEVEGGVKILNYSLVTMYSSGLTLLVPHYSTKANSLHMTMRGNERDWESRRETLSLTVELCRPTNTV